MGSQWTWAAETEMVMLSAAELEGGCTPSDTPDHQHGSLPLPSGGGDFVRHCEEEERWAAGIRRCRVRRNQGGGGVAPLEAGVAT